MPVHERRQHFRIDDQIYFDYKIMQPGGVDSEKTIAEDLLGQNGQRYIETTQYFKSLDYELSKLTQEMALKEPALAHYLNILNAKIDHLANNLLISEKIHLRKVNISLGGIAFKSKDRIKVQTHLKIVIYTKPKMIPIIIDGVTVSSEFLGENVYRTAVQFVELNNEQEQLLSQHIMLAQIKCRSD